MSKFMEEFGLRIQQVSSYQDILDTPDGFDATDRRQASLVLNDPYYGPLYTATLTTTGSHAEAVGAVTDAGCFDDRLDTRPTPDPWFLSGPYNLLADRYQKGKRNIVLVGTGSYDPMHNGHVAMMALTRDALLAADPAANIVGAVMSSSHDSYVRSFKTPEGVNQYQRVMQNQMFLEEHPANQDPWIIHDHWETQGVALAVNFTDVLNHIQAVLDTQVGPGIEVYYVFGTDAQSFAGTFEHAGATRARGACVVRPGYPVRPVTATLERTVIIEGGLDESSTRIRQSAHKPFLLRGDAQKATLHLADLVPDYASRIAAFQAALREVFTEVFQEIEIIDVDEQLAATRDHLDRTFPGRTIVSSDVYFTDAIPARSSRIFNPGSSQHHSSGTTALLKDSVAVTEPVVYVDDDIYTGFSLFHMHKHFDIEHFVSMAQLIVPGPYQEVADERDFLLGARNGGLVMAPGDVRYPYLGPFVNLMTRTSVPADKVAWVNHIIWDANRIFYAGTRLRPDDVGADFARTIGLGNEELETISTMFAERYTS